MTGRWTEAGNQVLGYLRERVWPHRIERILDPDLDSLPSEVRNRLLLALLDDHPELRQILEQMPPKSDVPAKAGETGHLLAKIRLLGTGRTRLLFLGATLRNSSLSRPTVFSANDPLPSWQLLAHLCGESAADFQLKLELAFLVDLFLSWLESGQNRNRVSAVKRWLASRSSQWSALHAETRFAQDPLTQVLVGPVLKTRVLLDLGAATMLSSLPEIEELWAQAEKSKLGLPFVLWSERTRFGYCSAQAGSLWAMASTRWAGLSTPLRLLLRPWRIRDPGVGQTQAKIVAALCGPRQLSAEQEAA